MPAAAGEFAGAYREVWAGYADLGEACSAAGSIDDETKRLMKLAIPTIGFPNAITALSWIEDETE